MVERQLSPWWGGGSSVRGGAAVPEAGSEVVAASHESGVGWRVNDAAHDVVVTQREEVAAFGRSGVPAAEADSPFVGEKDVVFGVVEHGLSPVNLASAQPSTCIGENCNLNLQQDGRAGWVSRSQGFTMVLM